MRFPGYNGADRQDPLIAPPRPSWSISPRWRRRRSFLRSSWTRSDLFHDPGLELHVGLDVVKDETRAEPRAHQSRVGAADGVQERCAVPATVL